MKLKGPLFSMEAKNTLGGLLEFSHRHGKNLLRFHQQPTGTASTSQTAERARYTEAVGKWNTLTDEEKKQWNDYINP